MKIFHFNKQEFQLLKSIEPDKVEFQKKTFARDVDVSQRAYPQVVKALQEQDDATTACLMVEMEGYYTIWHEIKISQSPATSASNLGGKLDEQATLPSLKLGASRSVATQPLSVTPTNPFSTISQPFATQSAQTDPALNVSDSQAIEAAIAKAVQHVVEEALAKNTHIVPEHLVEALRTEIAALASSAPITLETLADALKTELPNSKLAQQLAQRVLSDEVNGLMSPSLETRPESSTPEQSSVKKQKQYRGVNYEINSEPLSEEPPSEKKRQYRGKFY